MLFSETLDGKERTDHGQSWTPRLFSVLRLLFGRELSMGVYMSVISLQIMEALSEAVEVGE
jgi:hypothetical protein